MLAAKAAPMLYDRAIRLGGGLYHGVEQATKGGESLLLVVAKVERMPARKVVGLVMGHARTSLFHLSYALP